MQNDHYSIIAATLMIAMAMMLPTTIANPNGGVHHQSSSTTTTQVERSEEASSAVNSISGQYILDLIERTQKLLNEQRANRNNSLHHGASADGTGVGHASNTIFSSDGDDETGLDMEELLSKGWY